MFESENADTSYCWPMAGYIDAHVHFWDSSVLRYDWLDSVPTIAGRHGLRDYRAATADDPPDRFVFVQAGTIPADGGNEVPQPSPPTSTAWETTGSILSAVFVA